MIFTKNSDIHQLKEAAVVLIDKPLNWTSFDVVKKMKFTISKKLGVKQRKFKIGHAGTLDPLATGLLILCTGKATKTIQNIQDAPKEYTGSLTLGATTPSYDLESEIDKNFPTDHITEEACIEASQSFIGEIDQVPPIFSAIWVDGKRAYNLARKGETPELKSRKVSISSFDIDTVNFPEIQFKIACSKGTYIRSMAYDFGRKLNNGAYLSSLSRTKIGEHQLENAWNLDDFIEFINNSELDESI